MQPATRNVPKTVPGAFMRKAHLQRSVATFRVEKFDRRVWSPRCTLQDFGMFRAAGAWCLGLHVRRGNWRRGDCLMAVLLTSLPAGPGHVIYWILQTTPTSKDPSGSTKWRLLGKSRTYSARKACTMSNSRSFATLMKNTDGLRGVRIYGVSYRPLHTAQCSSHINPKFLNIGHQQSSHLKNSGAVNVASLLRMYAPPPQTIKRWRGVSRICFHRNP